MERKMILVGSFEEVSDELLNRFQSVYMFCAKILFESLIQ